MGNKGLVLFCCHTRTDLWSLYMGIYCGYNKSQTYENYDMLMSVLICCEIYRVKVQTAIGINFFYYLRLSVSDNGSIPFCQCQLYKQIYQFQFQNWPSVPNPDLNWAHVWQWNKSRYLKMEKMQKVKTLVGVKS